MQRQMGSLSARDAAVTTYLLDRVFPFNGMWVLLGSRVKPSAVVWRFKAGYTTVTFWSAVEKYRLKSLNRA